MLSRTYEALRAAGAPEDKARAAAEELAAGKTRLASIDNHLAKIDGRLAGLEGKLAGLEGRFTVLLWVVGVNAAAAITSSIGDYSRVRNDPADADQN
jgi:hypothetical protein